MKKKSLFAIFGGGLSLAMAAVAIGGLVQAGTREVKASEAVYKTWDFTAKTTSQSTYTGAWTYGSDCNIYGGANNNGGWAYIRTGGKSTAAGTSTALTSTYATKNAIGSALTKITLTALNIASGSGFTMNSVTLTVASDSAFATTVDTVSGVTVATSMTWTPSASYGATSWASGLYYKLTFSSTSTTTSNRGMDVSKVDFYYNATFGTLATIKVNNPANTLSFEGGETFTSAGLTLTATDSANNTKPVTSGFTTDFDAHVFTDADIGTKNVTVSYTEGSVTATCTYAITITEAPKWDSVFGSGLGYTAVSNVAGNVAAAEQMQTITASNLFWTADLVSQTSLVYFNTSYANDLALGSSTNPIQTATFTSGIVSISGALKISKVIVDASAGGTTTLAVSVGGTAVGTAQNLTASQVAYSFTPSTAAFGRVAITFSQPSTAKWIDIFRVRIYGTVDTTSNEGKAYALAARIEQANACASSTENTQLITDYNADATVKGLVDAINVIDYASAAIKSATVSYRSLTLTAAAKMSAISSLGGGAGNVLALNDSTAMISVAVVTVLGLLTLAGVVVLKKKHN